MYFHPDLRKIIDGFECDACQKYKVDGRSFGHLPARDVRTAPWERVDTDLIGPWKLTVNEVELEFNALTCIDPVTNLIEIVRLKGQKTADNARILFENHWLSRYPRPLRVVHDNGSEFIGHDFQFPLEYAGIKSVNISPHTPTIISIFVLSKTPNS